MHLRRLEVANELRQTFFELGICNAIRVVQRVMATTLTNDRLKAVLSVNGKASLARQLDRIDNVYTHLNHALYHHVVLLELWPSQLCPLSPTRGRCSQLFCTRHALGCTVLMQSAADGTGRDDSP